MGIHVLENNDSHCLSPEKKRLIRDYSCLRRLFFMAANTRLHVEDVIFVTSSLLRHFCHEIKTKRMKF